MCSWSVMDGSWMQWTVIYVWDCHMRKSHRLSLIYSQKKQRSAFLSNQVTVTQIGSMVFPNHSKLYRESLDDNIDSSIYRYFTWRWNHFSFPNERKKIQDIISNERRRTGSKSNAPNVDRFRMNWVWNVA